MAESTLTTTPIFSTMAETSSVSVKKIFVWPTVKEFFFRRSYWVFGLLLFLVAAGLSYHFINFWIKDVAPAWSELSPEIKKICLDNVVVLGFLGYLVPVICFGVWLGVVLFKDRFKNFPLANFKSTEDVKIHIKNVIINEFK